MAIPGIPQANIYGTGAVNPFAANASVTPMSMVSTPKKIITTPTLSTPSVNHNSPTRIAGGFPNNMKGPAAPEPISPLQKWLAGDTTYQQQLAEFNRSRSDETTDYNRQVSMTNRDYAQTQRQLNIQGQKDRMDQQNDFAGRGILHSGVYAKTLGDYNSDFNTKMQNLLTGRTDRLGDLSNQRSQFLRELQIQMNSAKQDAIRRRAQSLGL